MENVLMTVWVSSGCTVFFLQSKDIQSRSASYSILHVVVNGCSSLG